MAHLPRGFGIRGGVRGDVQQLTFEGVNLDPAYSADGSRIWFSSNRTFIANFEIFSMNSDGTNQLALTTNAAADTKPAR